MILTKEVTIKLNRGNIPYWKKYDEYKKMKIGDIIIVPIEKLPKSSDYKIKVKCDLCGEERDILYSTYLDSTKNQTEIYTCQGKCSNIKREQTNMKLYGVKNCFQSDEKKIKIKKTMKELYGVEHNMKLQRCLDQRIKTYQNNYGCDNPSQSENIKKKKIETCRKNYSVDYPFQSKENLEKSYKTNYIKYGTKIGIERGMSIQYRYYNHFKMYYPDFYLPKYNLIVEIKSDYTYEKEKDKNICKQKSCLERGYNFIFIINKNYEEFIQLIQNQKSAK